AAKASEAKWVVPERRHRPRTRARDLTVRRSRRRAPPEDREAMPRSHRSGQEASRRASAVGLNCNQHRAALGWGLPRVSFAGGGAAHPVTPTAAPGFPRAALAPPLRVSAGAPPVSGWTCAFPPSPTVRRSWGRRGTSSPPPPASAGARPLAYVLTCLRPLLHGPMTAILRSSRTLMSPMARKSHYDITTCNLATTQR